MDRRELIKLGAGAVASGFVLTGSAAAQTAGNIVQVERWGIFEAEAKGPSTAKAFTECDSPLILQGAGALKRPEARKNWWDTRESLNAFPRSQATGARSAPPISFTSNTRMARRIFRLEPPVMHMGSSATRSPGRRWNR